MAVWGPAGGRKRPPGASAGPSLGALAKRRASAASFAGGEAFVSLAARGCVSNPLLAGTAAAGWLGGTPC
eukprot:scaffold542_cov496-Prasinococcus_capsulatus_cf.AAC.3